MRKLIFLKNQIFTDPSPKIMIKWQLSPWKEAEDD